MKSWRGDAAYKLLQPVPFNNTVLGDFHMRRREFIHRLPCAPGLLAALYVPSAGTHVATGTGGLPWALAGAGDEACAAISAPAPGAVPRLRGGRCETDAGADAFGAEAADCEDEGAGPEFDSESETETARIAGAYPWQSALGTALQAHAWADVNEGHYNRNDTARNKRRFRLAAGDASAAAGAFCNAVATEGIANALRGGGGRRSGLTCEMAALRRAHQALRWGMRPGDCRQDAGIVPVDDADVPVHDAAVAAAAAELFPSRAAAKADSAAVAAAAAGGVAPRLQLHVPRVPCAAVVVSVTVPRLGAAVPPFLTETALTPRALAPASAEPPLPRGWVRASVTLPAATMLPARSFAPRARALLTAAPELKWTGMTLVEHMRRLPQVAATNPFLDHFILHSRILHGVTGVRGPVCFFFVMLPFWLLHCGTLLGAVVVWLHRRAGPSAPDVMGMDPQTMAEVLRKQEGLVDPTAQPKSTQTLSRVSLTCSADNNYPATLLLATEVRRPLAPFPLCADLTLPARVMYPFPRALHAAVFVPTVALGYAHCHDLYHLPPLLQLAVGVALFFLFATVHLSAAPERRRLFPTWSYAPVVIVAGALSTVLICLALLGAPLSSWAVMAPVLMAAVVGPSLHALIVQSPCTAPRALKWGLLPLSEHDNDELARRVIPNAIFLLTVRATLAAYLDTPAFAAEGAAAAELATPLLPAALTDAVDAALWPMRCLADPRRLFDGAEAWAFLAAVPNFVASPWAAAAASIAPTAGSAGASVAAASVAAVSATVVNATEATASVAAASAALELAATSEGWGTFLWTHAMPWAFLEGIWLRLSPWLLLRSLLGLFQSPPRLLVNLCMSGTVHSVFFNHGVGSAIAVTKHRMRLQRTLSEEDLKEECELIVNEAFPKPTAAR